MKKIILFFALFFSLSSAYSQGWEKSYSLGYPSCYYGYFNNIIPSKSGGYILNGFFPTCYIGMDNYVFFMKINDAGDTLWTRTYALEHQDVPWDQIILTGMIEQQDSSIQIIGTRHYDSMSVWFDKQIKLILDKNGNIIYSSYADAPQYCLDFLIENKYSDGYYTGGRDTNTTIVGPSIKKYNNSGTLLWEHLNTNPGIYMGGLQNMITTSDSGIVAQYTYGMSHPSGEYGHIYKLDKNGNLLWDKNFANKINCLVSTPSNGVAIGYDWGFTSTSINFFISEFDANGDSINGIELSYEPLKLVANEYGGYTVLGQVATSYLNQTFLIAYDSLWNTVWQQFDDNNYRLVNTSFCNWSPLLKTPENGYVFAGYYAEIFGNYLPKAIRTDSLGNTYTNSLSGRVTDDDGDCIVNGSDHGHKNIIVQADNGTDVFFSLTHSSGAYAIRADSGNYVVSHYPKSYRVPLCPSSPYAVSVMSTYDTVNNLNFHDSLTMNFTDVAVYITAWTPPVPGNNYSVDLTYENGGTDTASGIISFTYDSDLTFVSSSASPASVVGNTLIFNYAGFIEDSSATITLNFTVDTTAILGDTILCSTAITTVSTDIDLMSNTDQFMAIVVSSFDPNDKSVSPQGVGIAGYIAGTETLEYLVRFQNTGTYQAQNIVIRDSISNNLDMSTFQLLSSSFPCTVSIVDQRTMYFKFQNINLADSTSNEPASHGYVKYSIKPKAGLASGTAITNTAYIYFDFNEPVITNTALNTIAFPIGIEEAGSVNGSVIVYPNPFSDNTTFVIQSDKTNEIFSFELIDVLGKKVKSKTEISEKQFEISRDGLENGIYFYKIYTSESVIGIGKAVIK